MYKKISFFRSRDEIHNILYLKNFLILVFSQTLNRLFFCAILKFDSQSQYIQNFDKNIYVYICNGLE